MFMRLFTKGTRSQLSSLCTTVCFIYADSQTAAYPLQIIKSQEY